MTSAAQRPTAALGQSGCTLQHTRSAALSQQQAITSTHLMARQDGAAFVQNLITSAAVVYEGAGYGCAKYGAEGFGYAGHAGHAAEGHGHAYMGLRGMGTQDTGMRVMGVQAMRVHSSRVTTC